MRIGTTRFLNAGSIGGMDGNFKGTLEAVSGAALTKLLRAAKFAGYIAANSNLGNTQNDLMAAGADFMINKVTISDFITMDLFENRP
ncbi:hypothetical protein A3H38_06275 [candidate division WOR-1 bacterium RIFCSPLOWO2_02_FULL_46_20]|uniref:Uncharacterized protein n=1 Tax=candidate division WOR-1 bacterium RIFCSPLOWO2_02_FULL_46_20 TaxID=1802567 RepID=A0A1F4RF58_UNCSA|nr:MAG: hypothetical protein A3J44_02300 [candidate division WOR-1 bacterium RIFCSPHIGHO2_02_FULL_45_12]OGC06807.1 MAG: hypothetical protein A3H38_06275 [candidate division WOR-1 bacterium RIFCSPLOWO2_02_FULL_46_20]